MKNKYIGKLSKKILGKYTNRIITEDVILTDERKKHIYEDHPNDFNKIIENIESTIINPDEILEDSKNKDTIFIIKKLDINNLNVVVKLNTSNDTQHPLNSIMTAWIIRDKNLKKLREKNATIYKKE